MISYSQHCTLAGYVQDAQSSERLINAYINILNTRTGCVTNEQGYFSLVVDKGMVTLKVSYIGHSPDTFHMEVKKDTFIVFHLQPSNSLQEVTVTGRYVPQSYNAIKVEMSDMAKLPVLGGEADLMKTMQLLPGVQSTSEGQAGFSVRGGDNYQNLVLLDGVPVYNPYHLFGFFSIFNEKAIQDVTLYKGDFPARYGGSLSSVVDIQTKEGNTDHVCGSASLGLLASSGNVEGPFLSPSTTFFVSGRLSYLNVLASPLIRHFSGYETASYDFYDANAKLTHRFSNRDKLILSFYRSYDFGQTSNADNANYFMEDQSVSWGNLLGSASWNHVVTSKLFLNTLAHYSKYDYFSGNNYNQSFSLESTNTTNNYQSTIYDGGITTHLTWFHSSSLTMRGGIGYTLQVLVPGVESTFSSNLNSEGQLVQESNTVGNAMIRSNEIDAYSDNDIQLFRNLTLHAGLHYTLYKNNVAYQNMDPRINLEYAANRIKVGASFTIAHQYNHLLTTSNISEATDLWVPSTTGILPERSVQTSLTTAYFLDMGVTLKAEAYYKSFDHLLANQDGASYLTASSWQDMVTSGTGYSRGLSLTLEKRTGSTTGWITYTWSRTQRQFALINNGNPFPFDFDHRHDLKAVVMHRFSQRFDGSCTWLYHTGNYVNFGNLLDEGMYVYTSRNGYELSAYQRLDFDLNYHIRKRHRESILTLGCYNTYNYKNIYNIEFFNNSYLNGIMPNQPIYIILQQSLFPIIPSLTYRINFN